MYFYKEYSQPSKDPEKPDKIKRIYNNYDAVRHAFTENPAYLKTNT